MNDIVELLASSQALAVSRSVMTVFVVDGFQFNPDCPVMTEGDRGDDNNNSLGHWRLETCLPELRLSSAHVESPSLKPVPPPRPANLKTKLLDYKQAKGGLEDGVSLTNTDRDRPQKDGDLSRLQSKIPILKGSRSRLPVVKTEKFPHKICLKIENSREEEEGDLSLGGSCSGRTTPGSQIPRPRPPWPRSSSSLLSLPGMSGGNTPVRRWLHQSRDSLEVEFSASLVRY